MTDEQIIRDEAKEFYKYKISSLNGYDPSEDMNDIKSRLLDFYSSDSKAIFLDEIERLTKKELEEHRNQSHGGKPEPSCGIEIYAEKFLFYIKQEINVLPKIAHSRIQKDNSIKREKVFISYSHVDVDFLTDIKRHFKPFHKDIDFWDDSKIEPGQKWKDEIKNVINLTKVAILLVSADFLGSEFIEKNELPPLLKAAEDEGATILIVILKPCLFEEFDHLNQYQAMNSPSNPIIKMNELEKEELYTNLVRQTKRMLLV